MSERLPGDENPRLRAGVILRAVIGGGLAGAVGRIYGLPPGAHYALIAGFAVGAASSIGLVVIGLGLLSLSVAIAGDVYKELSQQRGWWWRGPDPDVFAGFAVLISIPAAVVGMVVGLAIRRRTVPRIVLEPPIWLIPIIGIFFGLLAVCFISSFSLFSTSGLLLQRIIPAALLTCLATFLISLGWPTKKKLREV